MPIQVTVVLDSGAFLTDEDDVGYAYSEVGYFIPHVNVYGDGELLTEIDAYKIGTGAKIVEMRHLDPKGNPHTPGVRLATSLVKNLLRLQELHGRPIHVDRTKFDCIFHFNSGHFCCSHVKTRVFKEVNGVSHTPTGTTRNIRPIAHDITVMYELADGEAFKMTSENKAIWSSQDHQNIKRRFDVELVAQHITANHYYCDSLQLGRLNYWLPNQGDSPPTWTHGGPGGTGNP